jgi:PadR family transcriptional regulator AphA
MPSPSAEPALSLSEWLVLCLVAEAPRHGFAIARLLGAGGSLGQVWRVPKPVVYRALQRLEQLGLVRTTGMEVSSEGPVRSLVDVTPDGRAAASEWLARPAGHNRDVRSELLAKLALLDRSGADPRPLLDAQREQLRPVAAALQERLAAAAGFDRTIAAWRWETLSATLRFLDAFRGEATRSRVRRSADDQPLASRVAQPTTQARRSRSQAG